MTMKTTAMMTVTRDVRRPVGTLDDLTVHSVTAVGRNQRGNKDHLLTRVEMKDAGMRDVGMRDAEMKVAEMMDGEMKDAEMRDVVGVVGVEEVVEVEGPLEEADQDLKIMEIIIEMTSQKVTKGEVVDQDEEDQTLITNSQRVRQVCEADSETLSSSPFLSVISNLNPSQSHNESLNCLTASVIGVIS